MPVFFIQDAIKFSDFVHAAKPEPHNEVLQAQSAHNNFWDYVGLQPECESWSAILLFALIVHQLHIWLCGKCLIEVRLSQP